MQRLFAVPVGRRVRIEAKVLRWADVDDEGHLVEEVLGRNIVYTAITTEHYWFTGIPNDVNRRLLIDHTLDFHEEDGIWQRDVDCYVVG